jgi:proteasome accessory factor B
LARVKVRFHKSLTRYLLERRWHPSQKNKKLKNGSLELSFEVAGTKEMKTWILGFGSLAGVLEPASLVNEIKGDLEKSLKSYGSTKRQESSTVKQAREEPKVFKERP